MLRNHGLGLLLFLVIAGCGSGEQQTAVSSGKPAKEMEPSVSTDNVMVGLSPSAPVSGDCVMVVVKGRATNPNFTWFLDDQQVQSSDVGQYCLPAVSRGKVVRAVLGKSLVGPSASVTIGNAPPKVLDSQLRLVVEERQRFLESSPVIEDPDQDNVTISYKWYVNGELNPFESGSRLDIGDIKKGDLVRLEIIPNDGFVAGELYATKESPVPGSPPLIVSKPPRRFRSEQFAYQVKARDPDGDQLEYRLENPPQGALIDSKSGLLTWPLSATAPGEYRLTIIVTDSEGQQDIQAFPLNISKEESN